MTFYTLPLALIDPDNPAAMLDAHFGAWITDAATTCALVLLVLKIFEHFKRKPPIEQEFDRLLRGVRDDIGKHRHDLAVHLSELRNRVDGAHQRIDILTHEINDKLQRLPGEIVDILHKTGLLHPRKM